MQVENSATSLTRERGWCASVRGGNAMTEAEWLECANLRSGLKYLRRPPGDRKLRLFLCACCRRVWDLLGDKCHTAVEIAQRLADGMASEEEMTAARIAAKADRKCYGVYFAYAPRPTFADVAQSARNLAYCASQRTGTQGADQRLAAEQVAQRSLLHDLFGNPFRPVQFDSAWLTWKDGTVRKIAQAIYHEFAFDRMPILADALEDAGCGDGDILRHCREPGEHVRGCWVIDLLLGKE
jgi:hypothetical protein